MGEQIVGSKISGTSYGYVAIPDRLVEKVGRIDDGETVNNPLEDFRFKKKSGSCRGSGVSCGSLVVKGDRDCKAVKVNSIRRAKGSIIPKPIQSDDKKIPNKKENKHGPSVNDSRNEM